MDVAYLIICHKNPNQVLRLIDRLSQGEGDVFVHIDQDAPQDMVSQLSAHCKGNKCFLVHDRLHGGLDCRRMIDITMNCIKEARMHAAQAGKQYRYFLLLSGQDYPIVPAAQIEEQLSRIYPAPILDCTKAEYGNWVAKKFERNRYLVHYRDFVLNRSRGPLRFLLQTFGVLQRLVLRLCGATTMQRMARENISLFGGSAWWILPDTLAEKIFTEYGAKTKLSETILEESVTPEETYFQTMAMQTAFSSRIHLNGPQDTAQNCKTYADFGGRSGRPPVCHPYILTSADFDRLKASGCWFARKFDEQVDTSLMDRIDSELL